MDRGSMRQIRPSSDALAQVTLLGRNFGNFRGRIVAVPAWIRVERGEGDVVKTYPLALL
jgi:hypothetical protein